MNKVEYRKILNYLDDGRIEELKKYLNERINIKQINSVRTALKSLINSDCEQYFPSYYQRTELHQGVLKIYRGLYTRKDDGFIICHKASNVFQLFDRSILTPSMEQSFEQSNYLDNIKCRKEKIEIISSFFEKVNEKSLVPVFSVNAEGKKIIALTSEDYSVAVPKEYYDIAHKLLGEDTKEYIDQKGMYFDSPNGRALLLKMKDGHDI